MNDYLSRKLLMTVVSEDKPLKAALVGFGISARVFHAPFLTTIPQFTLSAIVERSGKEAHKIYPEAKIVATIDDVINDPQIDVVVITTPNETHFPFAKKALLAGKTVVLEKPFTNTSEEARQLLDLARSTGSVLTVYQNRRYVSDFLTIREILNQQLLGEVHSFYGFYNRYRPEAKANAWREESRAGSGILYDLGAHLIDQALCLFGLPKSITADIKRQRPHARVDDYFDVWMDFGVVKATLSAGMLVREAGPRYLIHGTQGSFIKYGEDPQESALRAGHLPDQANWGEEPEEIHGILHTEIKGDVVRKKYSSLPGNFGQFYHNLYQSVVHKKPLREKPEHGYNTTRLIELAFESNRQRKTMECTDLMKTDY